MAKISESVLREPRSGIRKIFEMSLNVPGAIHLEIGEPQFATPAHIVEAACKALRDGYTKYTPNAGIKELREIIAQRRTEEYGYEIKPDNILVGIGGVEVINAVFRAVCEPGEEVLVPDPSWPNYKMMATISSTKVVSYHLCPENDFYPDMKELESLVTPKTKLLIVNSPSNPLGVVFDRAMMEKLVAFAEKHDIYLLSDEAYEKIVYSDQYISPLKLKKSPNVIAAHTMSKTYAMTGWRVGYIIADEDIIGAVTKLQEAYISSTPGAFQIAAVAALNGPQDCVEEMRAEYQRHRDGVATILDENGIEYYMPSGAFYIWIKVDMESQAFAEGLLQNKKVTVSPGCAFGTIGDGWIRISLASSMDDLTVGVTRMAEYLKEQRIEK